MSNLNFYLKELDKVEGHRKNDDEKYEHLSCQEPLLVQMLSPFL